jgi:hypothetical protein
MGMVYAAKKGETPASPEVAKAAAGISKKEARKFAKTKHKGLPEVKEAMDDQATQTAEPTTSLTDKKKEMMDKQKLANMKMLQQKERQLQNQKMLMKKSGKLPLEVD